MKIVIAAVVIIGLVLGSWQIWEYWQQFKEKETVSRTATEVPASQLRGLPEKLEPVLAEAQKKGANGLRTFLASYSKSIGDPRLASIELDYVILVTKNDIAEARRVFAKVKKRTDSSSPIYSRIKQMEKTYE